MLYGGSVSLRHVEQRTQTREKKNESQRANCSQSFLCSNVRRDLLTKNKSKKISVRRHLVCKSSM